MYKVKEFKDVAGVGMASILQVRFKSAKKFVITTLGQETKIINNSSNCLKWPTPKQTCVNLGVFNFL